MRKPNWMQIVVLVVVVTMVVSLLVSSLGWLFM